MLLALCACEHSPAPPAQEKPATSPATAAAPPAPAETQPSAIQAASEALSLPGDFSAGTDVAALEQRFGKHNVRIDQVPRGEGETSRGAVLFPDDAQRRAYLYFDDETALRGLNLVRVVEPDTQWTLDNGLRMGMPLKEVVALNGKPIKFYGLEWDYGGSVASLNGGKLEARKDAAVIRFRLGTPASDEPAASESAYPIGDSAFSSDDPTYPRQGDLLAISEITVSFPDKSAR